MIILDNTHVLLDNLTLVITKNTANTGKKRPEVIELFGYSSKKLSQLIVINLALIVYNAS